MARQDSIVDIDTEVRAALAFWIDIMDEITGGAFKRGSRAATPIERMREWDALTPEQTAQLKESKGDEWVNQQGAQIDRIRKQVSVAG